MSLIDILAAITANTDVKISTARKAHQARLGDVRTATEAELQTMEADVTERKEAKKVALRNKTTMHAESMIKNAELNAKQIEINALYNNVVEALAKLTDKELEPVFTAWINALPEGGAIAPSKKHSSLVKKIATKYEVQGECKGSGGFMYYIGATEIDYTFETVVQDTIRPATEVQISHSLFA